MTCVIRVIHLFGFGRARPSLLPRFLWLASLASLALALAGCTPNIGDKCVLSTDCSVTGTLVCDTSQPNGYCTVLNCVNGSCPGNSLCVMFQSSVPGCAYDDYKSPSRTGRSFCMAYCNQDSDCRQSDGYVCRSPTAGPWSGAILDKNQGQRVCIVGTGLLADASADDDAAVCQPYGADAGTGADARAEAGADAGRDAAPDAADGGRDGASDGAIESGSDGGADAANDAPADTGSADAPGGG